MVRNANVWLGSIFSVGSLIGGYVAKVASCKIATKISKESHGRKRQKDEGHNGDLKNYEDLKIAVLGDKISSETRNFEAGRILLLHVSIICSYPTLGGRFRSL